MGFYSNSLFLIKFPTIFRAFIGTFFPAALTVITFCIPHSFTIHNLDFFCGQCVTSAHSFIYATIYLHHHELPDNCFVISIVINYNSIIIYIATQTVPFLATGSCFTYLLFFFLPYILEVGVSDSCFLLYC